MSSSDVSSFEAAVLALEDPSRATAASAALESLRSSVTQALPLARGVLEATSHAGAQFHAILLLRAVCLRAWTELPGGARTDARELLLAFARSGAARAPPVQSAALVTAAVLFKRAWMDDADARAALPSAVSSLADVDARTRFAGALVEEFAGGAEGSGATALGLSAEWHRATAGAFERDAGGLKVVAGALAGVLIDAAAAAGAIVCDAAQCSTAARAADGLVSLIAWDWGGRGGGVGMSPRVAPGVAWGPLFADPSGTIANATATLLAAARGGVRSIAGGLAVSARALLCALAGVEGDVWNGAGGADAGAGAAAVLARALAANCLDAAQATADCLHAANTPLSSGAWSDAYSEATDVLGGIALAFRTHGTARMARVAGGATSDALSAAAGFAARALARAESIADAAVDARASDALEDALSEGGALRGALDAADAAAALWVAVAADLNGNTGPDDGFSLSSSAPTAATDLLAGIHATASQLYVALVRARLAIGRAVVALDIDDDSPFSDETSERDHHETVAALGRLDAAGSAALLASSARAAATALAQAPANPACAEELVLLAGYASGYLADDICGETPAPPPPLIRAARSNASAAAALVELPSAFVSALSTATGALGAGASPLLCEKLLRFAGRWASTWLLRPPEKGAATMPVSLARAFGPVFDQSVVGGDGGSYDAPLSTTQPVSGGASAAEALLSAAGTALVRAPDEPGVCRAAVLLLGTFNASALVGAAATRTPAFATLFAQANEGLNGGGGGLLGPLPDETAASALAALVLFSRFLGAGDTAADEAASEVAGWGDPAGAAEAAYSVAGGRGAGVRAAIMASMNRASPRPLSSGAASVLARRAGMWEPLVVGACSGASRALGALGAPGALHGAAGVAASARAARALTILAALTPVAGARAGVPDCWALDALLPALEALPFAFAAAASTPSAAAVGTTALLFFRAFFDVEWSYCGNETRDAARAYSAAAAAFRALAGASGGSGGALAPDDAAVDALAVLGVVGAIAEREVLSFAADSGSQLNGDGAAPASAALLEGLGVALSRARAAAGTDAKVDSALLDVSSLVIAHHPAAASRLAPPVFSSLIDALIAGITGAAPASARAALGAVRSLAATAIGAKSKGGIFAAALDLSSQLHASPDLWARLARAVLGASVGGAGLGGRGIAAELIGPAGDALLALAVADDGASFLAVARELLGALAVRSPALAQRVAGELETLTTVELLPRGAPAGAPLVRVPLSLDRYVKIAWAKQWEGFCERVHAASTVF